MAKQSSNETFNYMKSKGEFFLFVIQPIFSSGVATLMLVGFKFLFLWFDYGLSIAKIIFLQGIISGWSVFLLLFAGMSIILAITNGIRWIYYKKKSIPNE